MQACNIISRLRQFGDAPAIVWNEITYSYSRLLLDLESQRRALAQHGIQSGACVAVLGDFSPGTTAMLLALATNGNIVVPLTRSVLTGEELQQRLVYASSVIEFDSDDQWSLQKRNEVQNHPLLDQLRDSGEPGLILFSSGSTGTAKASLHNFNRLLSPFSQQRRSFRMLTFLLLDHMGGINTLLSVLCNGGVAITTRHRSAEAICELVERHQIELLPATPTFLNMLLISEAYRRHDLSSVKYISFGTESMPPSTLEALQRTFPGVKFRQLYGMTELGILPSRTHDADGLRVKLGGEGCEVKVIDGVLWVRASTAMLGYLNASSMFDEDGWFNTGDAVVEEDGYLRILGRDSEMINVGGEKVFPAEVENAILEVDNVQDVAVWGKPNPITGTIIVARVALRDPEEKRAVERRIRGHCKEKLAPFKIPALVEISEGPLHGARFKKQRSVET
jgi:long-chain acyl-CoA synthetase